MGTKHAHGIYIGGQNTHTHKIKMNKVKKNTKGYLLESASKGAHGVQEVVNLDFQCGVVSKPLRFNSHGTPATLGFAVDCLHS